MSFRSALVDDEKLALHTGSRLVVFSVASMTFAGVLAMVVFPDGGVGDAVLAGAAAVALGVLLVSKNLPSLPRMMYIGAILFSVYYCISGLWTADIDGFRHAVTAIVVFVNFQFFYSFGTLIIRDRILRYSIAVFSLVIASAAIGSDLAKNLVSGVTFYSALLFLFIVLVQRPKYAGLVILPALVALVVVFDSFRALTGLAAAFAMTFFAVKYLKSKYVAHAALAVAAVYSIAIVWFFISLRYDPLAIELDRFITSLTGRPTTSGRELLWPFALDAISRSPIFGNGAGMLPRKLFATTLSTHNFYLQILMQSGVVGLTFVFIWLGGIWSLVTAKANFSTAYGAAVFVVLMLHNASEVIMLQNALLVSMPAWITIAIACSAVGHSRGGRGGSTMEADNFAA